MIVRINKWRNVSRRFNSIIRMLNRGFDGFKSIFPLKHTDEVDFLLKEKCRELVKVGVPMVDTQTVVVFAVRIYRIL